MIYAIQPVIHTYERHHGEVNFVIVLNHSNENVALLLSIDIRNTALQNVLNDTVRMRPHEARTYKMNETIYNLNSPRS